MIKRNNRFYLGSESVTIRFSSDPTPDQSLDESRIYTVNGCFMRVRRCSFAKNVDALFSTYTYDGKDLTSVRNQNRGNRYNNLTTERINVASVLARLGYESVAIQPKSEPYPDLFANGPRLGEVGIEHTFGVEKSEAQFLAFLRDLTGSLNNEFGTTYSNKEISFSVAYPDRFKVKALLNPLLREIAAAANSNKAGEQMVRDSSVRTCINSFRIGPKLEIAKPTFTVSNDVIRSGLPDTYQAFLNTVKQKTANTYTCDDRDLWLVVTMSVETLVAPDHLHSIYATDLDIGPFNRLIVQGDYVVTFEPVDSLAESPNKLETVRPEPE